MIAGHIVSAIDWPGRIALVVFWRGCNLRCCFCHNSDLIPYKPSDDGTADAVSPAYAMDYLHRILDESDLRLVDGVVFTGGEFLARNWQTIERALRACQQAALPVRVDTNGTWPAHVRQCLERSLVEEWAVDIKASAERYDQVVGGGTTDTAPLVARTVRLLRQRGAPHVLRITVGQWNWGDAERIGEWIGGESRVLIQPYRPSGKEPDAECAGDKETPLERLVQFAERLRPFFADVTVPLLGS